MREKKRKGAEEAAGPAAGPTADAVGLAEGVVATEVGVQVIVFIVAEKRGLVGNARDGWVAAVTENLEEVGVVTVVDYILMVLGANQRLVDGGHRRLHRRTVRELTVEACEMVFGPDEGD